MTVRDRALRLVKARVLTDEMSLANFKSYGIEDYDIDHEIERIEDELLFLRVLVTVLESPDSTGIKREK